MPQHALDYRRTAGTLAPGYETTGRGRAVAADAGMIARHEHRSRQRQGDDRAAAALELRRRRLALLRLGG